MVALVGLGLILSGVLLWRLIGNLPGSAGARPIATLGIDDVHSALWSPSDDNVVYAGHHGGMLRSADGGRTWQPSALTAVDAMSLAGARAAPDRLYAAGHGVFMRSDDGGATWKAPGSPLDGADIHGFAQNPFDPDRLFALVVGQGLLASADGGRSWEQRSPTAGGHAALAVSRDGTQLLMGSGAQVQESADGGVTWRPSGAVLPGNAQIMALAPAPDQDVLFAATTAGLFRRSGPSAVWEATPLQESLMTVAVSPIDPAAVLAIDADTRVYRSNDGGATWSDAAP